MLKFGQTPLIWADPPDDVYVPENMAMFLADVARKVAAIDEDSIADHIDLDNRHSRYLWFRIFQHDVVPPSYSGIIAASFQAFSAWCDPPKLGIVWPAVSVPDHPAIAGSSRRTFVEQSLNHRHSFAELRDHVGRMRFEERRPPCFAFQEARAHEHCAAVLASALAADRRHLAYGRSINEMSHGPFD
jgi:hypothetical protein